MPSNPGVLLGTAPRFGRQPLYVREMNVFVIRSRSRVSVVCSWLMAFACILTKMSRIWLKWIYNNDCKGKIVPSLDINKIP